MTTSSVRVSSTAPTYTPNDSGTSGVVVIDAGSNLSTARTAGAGQVQYWLFDVGVDVGAEGANIVNAEPGDLYFVASA